MKNLWNKLPAWLKALILNVILLVPPIAVIQNTAVANLTYQNEWGWSLLVTLFVLIIYWQLVKKFTNFQQPDDIKLSLKFKVDSLNTWTMILGIMFVTAATIQLSSFLTDTQAEKQVSFFQQFMVMGPFMAIPVLFGTSLTAGVVEEVTYRFVMQNILTRAYSKWIGIIVIAALFAVTHFLPWQLIIPYMVVSILISLVAEKEKSIGLVIFAHFAVDFAFSMLGYFLPEAPFDNSLTMNLVWLSLLVAGLSMLLFCLNPSIKKQNSASFAQHLRS